jgi:hypothetical protein
VKKKTLSLGRVAFKLRVRKLMAVQGCQGGDELAPLPLKISTLKYRIASERQSNRLLKSQLWLN